MISINVEELYLEHLEVDMTPPKLWTVLKIVESTKYVKIQNLLCLE